MKVYSISKWAFGAICLLIIILPVSRHWKLLATGDKAQGTVTGFVMHKEDVLVGESELYYASEIVFYVDGNAQSTYGPANYPYKNGRKIKVFYQEDNPSENCIATFSGFYLDNYTVLPIILLTLWTAFYMSFNNYRKNQSFRKVKYGGQEKSAGTAANDKKGLIEGPIQSARRIQGSGHPSSKK
jgi:hypothetical protein